MTGLDLRTLVARAKQAFQAGRHAEARGLCEEALRTDRASIEALEIMGVIDRHRGAFDEAMSAFRRWEKVRPRDPLVQYNIGRVLQDLGRTNEALARFDRAIRADTTVPPRPQFALSKASALERSGEHAAARAILDALPPSELQAPATVAMLARLDLHSGAVESAIDRLSRRLEDSAIAPSDRQQLLFVFGKALDRAGEYDRAFEACREANALLSPSFEPAEYRAFVDRVIACFSGTRLAALPRASRRSEVPVFVAGMPRSGTTLIEQIIDAHPEGYGAGELIHLGRLIKELQVALDSYEPYPECVFDLDDAACDRLARGYLDLLHSLAPRARRVVNKSLDNFELGGLIAILFPGARIVFCRRDPVDTCLSCFLNPILPDRFPWITDLRNIGLAYREHQRLVAHWRSVLDIPTTEVVYEELVAEPEKLTRALIDFCGLAWDDRCLRFFESGRTVMTLSYDQVSRPIYKESVARWRNYEKYLGPLFDALGA